MGIKLRGQRPAFRITEDKTMLAMLLYKLSLHSSSMQIDFLTNLDPRGKALAKIIISSPENATWTMDLKRILC